MPLVECLPRALAILPVVAMGSFVVSKLYVGALLLVGRLLRGNWRFTAAMLLYLSFVPLLVPGSAWLLWRFGCVPASKAGLWLGLFGVCAAGLAFYWAARPKLHELRRHGFFL